MAMPTENAVAKEPMEAAPGADDAGGAPPNPPVSEDTRKEFAAKGIFQGPDGAFYENSQVMKKPDGKPMTEADVKAELANREKKAASPEGAAPPVPADMYAKKPDGAVS